MEGTQLNERAENRAGLMSQGDGLGEDFHFEDIILRRADPDDCDAIINLVEIGEDDIYNRVYSYPKILKLIETAYLALTVIDRNSGAVVAFAAFEDYPQGQRGMTDDKHFNHWEDWLKNACKTDDFSAFNTLWLSYFICGAQVGYQNQHHVFKQVLHTVYTSLSDLIGILFLVRGDADEEDFQHCFGPLQRYFQTLPVVNKVALSNIRGIHADSGVCFSSRVNVIPYIEVRAAKQEDHDDLADVFNSQSETVTEAYGEYFIAELIASQNEENRALVAQVKDKAVGLMGLTNEVDLKLLHKCFDLDTFDNLLKPEFMDSIRARRALLAAQEKRKLENEQIAAKRKLKQETMKCNIVAQRICLQEHLLARSSDILEIMDNFIQNEEDAKEKLSQEYVINELFNNWLAGFKITQPGDYFLKLERDDIELEYSILTEIELMMKTLECFGLPEDYINGNGHHANWGKDKDADKKKKGNKKKTVKQTAAQKKIAAKYGSKQVEEEKRPTYFDFVPMQKALKRFFACTPDARSNIRSQFIEKATQVRSVFRDKYNELSYKKVVDAYEFSGQLVEAGFVFDQLTLDSLGGMLLAFGDLEVERSWGDRNPPETEDQKRARLLLQIKLDERKKDAEEWKKRTAMAGAKPPSKEEEEKRAQDEIEDDKKIAEYTEKSKPKPQIKVKLAETSIHDLLIAMNRMAQYDRLMSELGMLSLKDWQAEDKVLAKAKKPFEVEFVDLPPIVAEGKYSSDPEIQAICEQLDDQTTIPDPPASAKNAFAMTLFCMESAFDCRSKDFLKYAFEQFPDKDYLLVTQPHTVAETALLNKFTLVPKKSINTFSHVLYIIHRDQLYEQDMCVLRSTFEDIVKIRTLLESSGQQEKQIQEIIKQITEATMNNDAPWLCFTAQIMDNVIGAFLISKDVNLEYYKSHFHIQDQLLLSEHDRKGHCRLIFSTINPIFERSTRFLLKEVLRLSGKTSMYFEVQDATVIPTIFHELVHIRLRRFPHFLDKKWDHERWEPKVKDDGLDEDSYNKVALDGGDRNPQDEKESNFALCFTTKRLLSETKLLKNARIVVVGASDTGISFVEALLSITYLKFSNITFIAPGGLPHHHNYNKKANLKAYSTSYTTEECKRLLLESRATVIDSRMTDIDRSDKNIILNDGRVVPYDTLILAMGIQDNTLNCDKGVQFVSYGINSVPPGKRQCKGVLSIDDPYLHKFLAKDGEIMSKLTDRRRQTNCVIYGRSLNTYTMIQGMLDRGVQPKCITLAIPKENIHVNEDYDSKINDHMEWIYPNAFEDSTLEEKIQKNLEAIGITIVRECKLIEIITDKDKEKVVEMNRESIGLSGEEKTIIKWDNTGSLERIVLKRLDILDQEEEDDEYEQDEKQDQQEMEEMGGGTMDDSKLHDEENGEEETKEKKKKRKRNEMELECGLLVTCGHRDIDQDVFSSIHNNGLVYNGRLIVDKNFQTTDQSIFSAGSLCEFSNKYLGLAQGRSLRMDHYNGREMGSRLARSVFDIYDPQSEMNKATQSQIEEIPQFYLPTGYGGVLPANLIYYHIKTSNPLIYKKNQEEFNNHRADLVCDNLDIAAGKGHFIKFTFNSIGLIDSVTYMGDEEVILQSLWSFVGLHENYLNQLTSRYESGIIPNVVEFLSENWAIALYHEWFGDFCLRMRQGIRGLSDVQAILQKAFDQTKTGLGLSRPELSELRTKLDEKTVKMIEDETLEFIKTNMNHLPMYYIPGQEFA